MKKKGIRLTLISPADTLFKGEVSSVSIPMYDGLVTLLPGHAPLIGKLGSGLLSLQDHQKRHSFVIEGGFVHVGREEVSILINSGEPPGKRAQQQAQQELQEALKEPAQGDEAMTQKLEKIAAARARLRYSDHHSDHSTQ